MERPWGHGTAIFNRHKPGTAIFNRHKTRNGDFQSPQNMERRFSIATKHGTAIFNRHIKNNKKTMPEETPYLDKSKEIQASYKGKLPHWHQDGKLQFVTFRLNDSLPQSKIRELNEVILSFEKLHPKPWDERTTQDYHNTIGPKYEVYLDNGYGNCILRNPWAQNILINVIFFYNNLKYEVVALIIMPNHVHIILHLKDQYRLDKIIQSIKRQSAREINKYLNQEGPIWMKGYYDRIVRSYDNLKHYIKYIIDNPKMLKKGEYSLYLNSGYSFLW